MNYFKVTIVADFNDYDLVTKISKVSEDELEEVILPVAKVLKRESHNWVRFWDSSNRSFYEPPEVLYKDLLTPDQISMFDEICPTCEGGIHSIESISITPWVEDQLIFP
jgi:hypothetical protein